MRIPPLRPYLDTLISLDPPACLPIPGLHNIRPAGHMRPARSFLAARENSVAENVAKARLRIITCPFRISSTLWRNRLLRPAASLCWSVWPFELSELCRPDQYNAGARWCQSLSLPFSAWDEASVMVHSIFCRTQPPVYHLFLIQLSLCYLCVLALSVNV